MKKHLKTRRLPEPTIKNRSEKLVKVTAQRMQMTLELLQQMASKIAANEKLNRDSGPEPWSEWRGSK